jgi:exosortase
VTAETKLDIRWSILLGAVLAASPLTGAARPGVSIAGGVLVGGAVFAFRRLRRRRQPAPPEAVAPLFEIATLGPHVWALLGGAAVVFLPTLWWLYGEYTEAIWRNGHGLFVPIIMVLLARSRLRSDESQAEESSKWGIPLLVVGALLAVIDSGVRMGFLGTVGLVIALPGLSLLLLGSRRTRAIAFPLALGLFLIPLPVNLPEPLALPSATATLTVPILKAFGIPVVRHQTAFLLPAGIFMISTNCSGISTFYAAVFFALALASQTGTRARKVILLLSPWPVTVGVNAIRSAFLFALCNRYGLQVINTPIHGLTGIGTFWAVMLLILLLAGHPRSWKMRP